jgi:peptidyl-tRNA hydrolase, PTH1 family
MFGRKRPPEAGVDLLIVGLGNPGSEYDGTRHNVGADVVSLLASRFGERLKAGKERAWVADLRISSGGAGPGVDSARVMVAFPQTFMNLSGESVKPLMRKAGVGLEQVVVVHDELDLPSGRLKLKLGGGSGGHNGLKSISALCGGPEYVRVRIGIGRPPGRQDPADYVLKKPGKAERADLDVCIQEAADAIEALLAEPLADVMTRVNSRT